MERAVQPCYVGVLQPDVGVWLASEADIKVQRKIKIKDSERIRASNTRIEKAETHDEAETKGRGGNEYVRERKADGLRTS